MASRLPPRGLSSLALMLVALALPCGATARSQDETASLQQWSGPQVVQSLQTLCAKCHGERRPRADYAVHDLQPDQLVRDLERWEKALEMLSIGDMPPPKAPQPTREDRARLVEWMTKELQALGRGPQAGRSEDYAFGNRLDHEVLFGTEDHGPASTPSRLWRIRPSIYERFATTSDLPKRLSSSLSVAGRHFGDSAQLTADESTLRTMLQNGRRLARSIVYGVAIPVRGRVTGEDRKGKWKASRHRLLTTFADGTEPPTEEELREVVQYCHELLLHRPATEEEVERAFEGFLRPKLESAGRGPALEGYVVTLLLSPEFLYRRELGQGPELDDGRRMLSPRELAFALSYAVFDSVEPTLLRAAEEGRLSTREDVEREFRRVLGEKDRRVRGSVASKDHVWVLNKGDNAASHARLLEFFREFFGYTKAAEVFKDEVRHGGKHDPQRIVRDADWFVLAILREDRQVLERLLTSRDYYVGYPNRRTKPGGYSMAYNLDSEPWEISESVSLPPEQRAGMLTHPAWLVAHSGNFENDPVRRGKWIREHLLAGVVPDIPIGVEAQLPEEPHHTLRERFRVVRTDECWRCHRKMNPLGEAFEAYDDFGRFREGHLVEGSGTVLASELETLSRHRPKPRKGEPPESFGRRPVDTSGELQGTGDPALDGPVDDAIDLVERLARSSRVRQSFLRHVFRYWMGRNETLADAGTLRNMEAAYLDSDGSFTEVLVALVRSDSFLLRSGGEASHRGERP